MEAWVLKARDDMEERGLDDPWSPWYHKSFGFVIIAETEEEARGMAAAKSGYENDEAWLDKELSVCKPIGEFPKGIVLQDYRAA